MAVIGRSVNSRGRTMENKRVILVAVLLAALVLLAGALSYRDAKQAESQYCADVQSGLYPDYQGNYDEICPKED